MKFKNFKEARKWTGKNVQRFKKTINLARNPATPVPVEVKARKLAEKISAKIESTIAENRTMIVDTIHSKNQHAPKKGTARFARYYSEYAISCIMRNYNDATYRVMHDILHMIYIKD